MNVITRYLMVFRKAKPYSLFVLLLLFLTYLVNQLDRYALPIVAKKMAQEIKFGDQECFARVTEYSKNCSTLKDKITCEDTFFINDTQHESACEYNYNGKGAKYQAVAGPSFILIFSIMGVFVSYFADSFRNVRVYILAACLVFWSVMTILNGFIKEYWQLVVLRFGVGFGEAGCNPIATSLISDYFSEDLRGSALGIYNWGIYTGYSMSIAIGNPILQKLSWRWVYFICGIPGIVLGIILIIFVRTPRKDELESKQQTDETPIVRDEDTISIVSLDNQQPISATTFNGKLEILGESELRHDNSNEYNFIKDRINSILNRLWIVVKVFLKPTLLLLCIASSIRNGAGYVWGYNYNFFYTDLDQTPEQITYWLSWIPIVGGLTGSFLGGFISDRLVSKSEPYKRIWVLVISQMLAVPFLIGVLTLKPPYSYICLIPSYLIGEMWVGTTLSVVIELVPEELKNTGVGFYFFIITNIGGNMQNLLPLLMDYFKKNHNFDELRALRSSLYILYPGSYVLGSLLFLLTLFVIKYDYQRTMLNKSNTIRDGVSNPNFNQTEEDKND